MTDLDALAAELGPLVRRDVPLGPLTTYRVGGAAALFAEVASLEELVRIGRVLGDSGVPVLVVGKGSNLLVLDGGFPGLALSLGDAFAAIDIVGTRVVAGGAASLPVVARRTAGAGLTGFEWAVGVPGSIGGAVRMNAGGHGSDMAASLVSIRVVRLDGGEHVEVPADQLDLGYRSSNLTASTVVVDATLELAVGDPARSRAEIDDIVRWRRANQPGGPNAGSVFRNPPDDHAGRLVEAAGCKGLRLGSAQVSDKHANFIQADPDGSADDVLALMREVAERVRRHSGVELVAETHVVGEPAR